MSDKEFEVEHETITFILSLRLSVGINFLRSNYSDFFSLSLLSKSVSVESFE